MKKLQSIGILVAIIAISLLSACGSDASKKDQLTFEGYSFAKTSADGKIEETTENTFAPGDAVHLVFKQVKTFELGEDGKHHLDLDLNAYDAKNQVIFSQEKILGESGITVLEQGVADSPYGTFHTSKALESGEYTLELTLHDLVANTSVSQKAKFKLQ